MTLNLTQLIRFWNTSPPYRVSFLDYTPLIPSKTYIFWIKTKLISQVVNKIIKNLNISQTPVHSDQDKKNTTNQARCFFLLEIDALGFCCIQALFDDFTARLGCFASKSIISYRERLENRAEHRKTKRNMS